MESRVGVEGEAVREMQELVTGNKEGSLCKGRSIYREDWLGLKY